MFSIAAFKFLAAGSLLGLTAGISPGPLLTLVLTQTLKYNKTEGIKIAVSPLITDLPVVLITLFIFARFSHIEEVLGIISVSGGLFIAYLGYDSLKSEGLQMPPPGSSTESLRKGTVANILSPHPYLFWGTVGAPYVFKASEVSLMAVILFLVSFYFFLVGSKIAIAIIADRTKKFIGQGLYIPIIRVLGLVLIFFSLLFFYEGYSYFFKGMK